MNKPTKQIKEPYWDYHDVIDYIEKKYDIETRGYKKKEDGVYRDFWHWYIDCSDISNGCYSHFGLYSFLIDSTGYTPDWVKEILQLIYDEFKEDEMLFWIEW